MWSVRSRGPRAATILKLTCRVYGTNPSILERKITKTIRPNKVREKLLDLFEVDSRAVRDGREEPVRDVVELDRSRGPRAAAFLMLICRVYGTNPSTLERKIGQIM